MNFQVGDQVLAPMDRPLMAEHILPHVTAVGKEYNSMFWVYIKRMNKINQIRVLLVDDHPILRAGLRDILASAPDIEVVGDAQDGEEALQMVLNLSPDVLVLDMEMPGKGGIEVAQELRKKGSLVHILAFSGHNERRYIESVLTSGASGYLVKDEMQDEIVEAVRGVARGEQGWISRQITTKMFSWMQDQTTAGSSLTDREGQVLQQLLIAKTNQEIALALGISEKTVEKHMEAIFQKLGVGSRTEAAVWAAREEFGKSL